MASPVSSSGGVGSGADALARIDAAYEKLNNFQAAVVERQSEQKIREMAFDTTRKAIENMKA